MSACVDSENNGQVSYKTANGSLIVPNSAVPIFAPDTSKINFELAYDIPPPPEAILDKDIAERVDISRPRAATFSVQYIANGQQDPATAGGTAAFCQTAPLTGTTSISSAVNAALNIWASQLNSPQRINVQVCWRPLGSATTLAQAGPRSYTPMKINGLNLYIPTLLANAIKNIDHESQLSDITIAINPTPPKTSAGTTTSWHVDPTTAPAANAYDLTSVLIHELGHGFGLASLGLVGSTSSFWQLDPNIAAYDSLLLHITTSSTGSVTRNILSNRTLYPNNSTALHNAFRSNAIYFNGSRAAAANGGSLVPIQSGTNYLSSSLSHLHLGTYQNTVNAMMTPVAPAPVRRNHNPGPIAHAMLQDIGWSQVPTTSTLGTATLTAPSGTITTRTPQYNWSAVSLATKYYLQILNATSGAVIFQSWVTNTAASCASGTACRYTPPTLAAGNYKWRIIAGNTAGNGPSSTYVNFTVR